MSLPFWRAYALQMRATMRYDRPTLAGGLLITYFDDGAGPRPVTDLEWKMFFAFSHLDMVIAEGARHLDALHRQTASRITALR